jgi:hypothetical protein
MTPRPFFLSEGGDGRKSFKYQRLIDIVNRARVSSYAHRYIESCMSLAYCVGDRKMEAVMAFRADEAARDGFEREKNYLFSPSRIVDKSKRNDGISALEEIIRVHGPVVTAYPSWHPLVCHHDPAIPVTRPERNCGYEGLDHTVYFANAFITCPYGGEKVIYDSVEKLTHPIAKIRARKLDVMMFDPGATPILVECDWGGAQESDGTISLYAIMYSILRQEIRPIYNGSYAESWETMRPYFLGEPRGSRSSLFVSQESGRAIKKVWEAIISTGMFGPVKE